MKVVFHNFHLKISVHLISTSVVVQNGDLQKVREFLSDLTTELHIWN